MSTVFELNEAEFMASLVAAVAKVEVQSFAEVGLLAKETKSIAEKKVPVGKERPGEGEHQHLKDNIVAEPGVDALGKYWAVGTKLPQGGYLEYGTPGHWTMIRNARVLTDGESFFGTKVYTPAMPPRPWLRPSLMEAVLSWRPVLRKL